MTMQRRNTPTSQSRNRQLSDQHPRLLQNHLRNQESFGSQCRIIISSKITRMKITCRKI